MQQNPPSNSIPYPLQYYAGNPCPSYQQQAFYTNPQTGFVQLPGAQPPFVPPPPMSVVVYRQQPFTNQTQQTAEASGAPVFYQPDPNVGWAAAGVPTTPYPESSTPESGPTANNRRTVQPEWCDICQISCNSRGVFDQHKLGKKHLRNLEKLQRPAMTTSAPPAIVGSLPLPVLPASTPALPVAEKSTGPVEKNQEQVVLPSNSQKARMKRKAAAIEDLESKQRKVVQSGASAESVRTCILCNVVCNTQKMFDIHVNGLKHFATMKKYGAAGVGAAALR